MNEVEQQLVAEDGRLAVLRSVASELAKPGDAREQLPRALDRMSREFCRQAVLEIIEPDGQRSTVRAGIEHGCPAGWEVLALPVLARQRSWGTLTLHSKIFGAADRLVGELLADRIASYLDHEYMARSRPTEVDTLLLGIVGHDLRNPLGVVTLAASTLQASELNPAQRRTLARLVAASQQSTRLVSDLLDFTIARRGGIPLVRARFDLHQLVGSALEDLRAMWPGREVVHERVGVASCFSDEDRIQQIVMNLVGNALQHSPPATVVRVETRGEPGATVFTVENEGRPIPPALMEQLFSPLRRGDGAGKRNGSVGLGLFIVHHLVLAHGGTIEVTSNERDGTRFTVRLPDGLPAAVS